MNTAKHRVGAYLWIQGAEFSPTRAEAELGVKFGPVRNEPGETGTKGKFAGKQIPFGSTQWEFQWEPGPLIPEAFTLFDLPDLKGRLTGLGAEEISLHFHVGHTGQCNIEMSPAQLVALAGLGVTVCISCFESSDGPQIDA